MRFAAVFLALAALVVVVFAQDPTNAQTTANDQKTLNFALFLERLEADFYDYFQNKFTQAEVNAYGAGIYEHLEVIRSHEDAHVNLLQSALGSAALPNCTYTFNTSLDVPGYLATARLLEATGVTAYNGAVNTINDRAYAIVAATIDTVEARHSAYLYEITGNIPFPNETDFAVSPVDIKNTVVSLFAPNCPAGTDLSLLLPSVLTINPTQLQITFSNGTVVPPSANTQNFLNTNDINTLQYALVLEHLEATFYNTFQAQFDASAFAMAGYPQPAYSYFDTIKAHENGHVSLLTNAINGLVPNSAVGACPSYDWSPLNNGAPITTVGQYIAVAKILESTGVSAYDNALGGIASKTYQQVAATIATVEARHTSFISYLLDNSTANAPFPTKTDTPLNVSSVVNAISGVIGTCGGANLAGILPSSYTVQNLQVTAAPTPAPSSAPTTSTPTTSTPTTSTPTTSTPTNAPTATPATTSGAASLAISSVVAVVCMVILM